MCGVVPRSASSTVVVVTFTRKCVTYRFSEKLLLNLVIGWEQIVVRGRWRYQRGISGNPDAIPDSVLFQEVGRW